jgi:hypothetical protein
MLRLNGGRVWVHWKRHAALGQRLCHGEVRTGAPQRPYAGVSYREPVEADLMGKRPRAVALAPWGYWDVRRASISGAENAQVQQAFQSIGYRVSEFAPRMYVAQPNKPQ